MYKSSRMLRTTAWLFLLLVLSISACRTAEDDLIKPSSFTKVQQEELGDLISSAISIDSRNFSLLPHAAPFDSVYWYTQRLYGQVTHVMHLDHQSPTANRWTSDRTWMVHLLIDEQMNAFVIPGGDFYITTGLLKLLRSEHELYYIMAFEASLMNERFLFNRLITNYNTSILADLVAGRPAPGGATPGTIALKISNMTYEVEDLQAVEAKTIELICASSIFDPAGILTLKNNIGDSHPTWLAKSDYPGRASLVQQLVWQIGPDCGEHQTDGGYEKFVLNRLP